MENYRAIVKHDLNKLRNSKKELKDIFKIAFSHEHKVAYERLDNYHLESLTYKELNEKIVDFAIYLREYYLPSNEEYIAIDLTNSPLFLIAFWGSLMAGYKPYLVNSYYPSKLRISLLNRLNIKRVITLNKDYLDFENIDTTNYSKKIKKREIKDEWWANNFAISSSLTGLEAKIIIYDGNAIANEILNSDSIIKENPWFMKDYHHEIKVAAILPFFHIFGILVSYIWFAFYGRTIVFFNNLSEECVRSTIIRHKVTHIFAPPILFNKLYEGIIKGVYKESLKKQKLFNNGINLITKVGNIFPRLSLFLSHILMKEVRLKAFGNSPQFMISGGAFIKPSVLKIINAIGYPLFNGYGTTEASITGANFNLKFKKRTDGSIGKPFLSVDYSLDSDNTLIISGSSLAKEILYLDGKIEKINKFYTNDLVSFENNTYFIKGRKSDLFISENGENISPDIIEQELNISLASSFSVLEIDNNLSIILEYKKGLNPILINKEIEVLKNSLSYKAYGNIIKRIWITYDKISNENAIKVSRTQLKNKIMSKEVSLLDPKLLKVEPLETENNEIISIIKNIFKECISVNNNVENDSDYFIDLGGDSLGYLSLISRIEEEFDISFDLEKDGAMRTPNDFYNKVKEKR